MTDTGKEISVFFLLVLGIDLIMASGFFKGTSADQDRRFSDKELKLLKTMKFPPEFNEKVCQRSNLRYA